MFHVKHLSRRSRFPCVTLSLMFVFFAFVCFRFILVHHQRLELWTPWLRVRCSTNWANGAYLFFGYIKNKSWHRPIFPGRHQPSIFGTIELNFRVRNGNGWTLNVINTNFISLRELLALSKLNKNFHSFKLEPFTLGQALDLLVLPSLMRRHTYTRSLSTL